MFLLPHLPSTSLHLIPSLIPEAVLATKEPAERTRAVAFDLVVAMGRKMKDGGVVKRHRMDGMEEDDASATEGTFLVAQKAMSSDKDFQSKPASRSI